MSSLLESLTRYLTEDGWKYEVLEPERRIRMSIGGKNGSWSCGGLVGRSGKVLVVYSFCQSNAPPEKRVEMAECLTRANYALPYFNLAEGVAHRSQMQELFIANILTFDRYLPGIMAVLYGGATPAEAVAKVESKTEA